jgi:phage baseplate assembly protein W
MTGENIKINLAPQSLVEEVTQNLLMILSTPAFSVPLDRQFGLSARFADKPMPGAESTIVAEIIDAIEAYEPRAELVDVTFERDGLRGKITPRLEVKINE